MVALARSHNYCNGKSGIQAGQSGVDPSPANRYFKVLTLSLKVSNESKYSYEIA